MTNTELLANLTEIFILLENNNVEKAKEVVNNTLKRVLEVEEEKWNSGSVLPPMYARFLVKNLVTHEQYTVNRTELANSYSPEVIQLNVLNSDGSFNKIVTLNKSQFQWRHL